MTDTTQHKERVLFSGLSVVVFRRRPAHHTCMSSLVPAVVVVAFCIVAMEAATAERRSPSELVSQLSSYVLSPRTHWQKPQ